MVGCRSASWIVAVCAVVATTAAGCLEAPPDDGADLDCPGNLISNPSFEDGTYGWGGNGGDLSLSDEGRIGDRAIEVCSFSAAGAPWPSRSRARAVVNSSCFSVSATKQTASQTLVK